MARDEGYIIDLCDKVLGRKASRQHRFPFLLGDCGKNGRCQQLPVDAYYHSLQLVVEYHERQHSEGVLIMDRRVTISGCTRDIQRRIYDERRRQTLPLYGIALIQLDYTMFPHDSQKRLHRSPNDEQVIRASLERFTASLLPVT